MAKQLFHTIGCEKKIKASIKRILTLMTMKVQGKKNNNELKNLEFNDGIGRLQTLEFEDKVSIGGSKCIFKENPNKQL